MSVAPAAAARSSPAQRIRADVEAMRLLMAKGKLDAPAFIHHTERVLDASEEMQAVLDGYAPLAEMILAARDAFGDLGDDFQPEADPPGRPNLTIVQGDRT